MKEKSQRKGKNDVNNRSTRRDLRQKISYIAQTGPDGTNWDDNSVESWNRPGKGRNQ